jgi:Cu2+-containing amine oxidase
MPTVVTDPLAPLTADEIETAVAVLRRQQGLELLEPCGFFDRNPALDVPAPNGRCEH